MFFQIILATIIGTCFALLFPSIAKELNTITKCYIQLIKMVINPLLFLSIVVGVSSHQHTSITRLAVKSFLYFEVIAVMALLLAFVSMQLSKPGEKILLQALVGNMPLVHTQSLIPSAHPFAEFLLKSIPTNFFSTLASDNLIATLVLSIVFSISIRNMKAYREPVISFCKLSLEVFYSVTNFISRLAPIAIFSAIAVSVSTLGFKTLKLLSFFLISYTLSGFVFVVILYIIAKLNGLNLFSLIKYLREELLVVFGTASSESVFPQMIQKLERFGCGKNVVSFVMPANYAFNLGGSALFVSMACLFIQQAFHVHFNLHDFFVLFLFILILSKGAAGVNGGCLIVLSAVLSALPNNMLPIEGGMALIIGIYPLMAGLITVLNLIGYAQATVLMAKSEKEYRPNF